MKINELKRIAEENDYEYEMRHFQYKLKKMQGMNCITISNDVEKTLWISNKSYCDKKDFNMIKAAVEFSETPIPDREEEKKYFYEHNFIKTSGGNPTYLAIRERPNNKYPILQGSYKNFFEYKVEFTDKEMEETKKQYGIFLDDFVKKEIIEE